MRWPVALSNERIWMRPGAEARIARPWAFHHACMRHTWPPTQTHPCRHPNHFSSGPSSQNNHSFSFTFTYLIFRFTRNSPLEVSWNQWNRSKWKCTLVLNVRIRVFRQYVLSGHVNLKYRCQPFICLACCVFDGQVNELEDSFELNNG